MKNSKKILMAASVVAAMTLSGCAYNTEPRLYTNSPEFREFKENLDSEERRESASYHVIGGTTVLRVGNRYYVR